MPIHSLEFLIFFLIKQRHRYYTWSKQGVALLFDIKLQNNAHNKITCIH